MRHFAGNGVPDTAVDANPSTRTGRGNNQRSMTAAMSSSISGGLEASETPKNTVRDTMSAMAPEFMA